MKTIDYRALAEDWLEHVARQYAITRVSRQDTALIEHLLRSGFTVVAVGGEARALKVDFLGKRNPTLVNLKQLGRYRRKIRPSAHRR